MKRCFVIMPYGGEDPTARKRFDGIYQAIIVPAARQAGYEPKRSDIAGVPGNITHDIVRDLGEADVVIADLTTGNANVFFELGIRHAFRKSGTVHIIDVAHSLPFDVQQYRAIKYSTDLADIPDVVSQIANAMAKRETQPDRADNPVHDALPQLPFDILATSDSALQRQLTTVQGTLKELRAANDVLSARLAVVDPASAQGAMNEDVDVDALLDRAEQITLSTGSHAILRLRQAMQDGGADTFVKTLRQVLKSPYLDENDFMEIVVLCKEAGLSEHRRATLELARQRYPHSDEIFLALVDVLDDSPNLDDQERGRVMLERRLAIDRAQGVPKLSTIPGSLSISIAVALLFNFYNRQQKHEWILSVYDSLPQAVQNEPLMLRNRARALARLQRSDEALSVFEQAMELDPTDDQTILWYSSFLDDQGKYAEAYKLSENAILADPEDPRLYFHMAIQIFNRGYVRTSDGALNGPLPRQVRAKVAVPFMLRAIAERTPPVVEEAVRILVRGKAIAEAQAIAAGEMPKGRYDTAALDYLVQRMTSPGENGAGRRLTPETT